MYGKSPYRNVLDGYESQELGLGITKASQLTGEYFFIISAPATAAATMALAAVADPSVSVSATAALNTGGFILAAVADPSISVSATATLATGNMALAAVADPSVSVPTTASAAMALAAVARRATGGLYTAGDFGRGIVGQNAKAAPAKRPNVPVERKHGDDATAKFAREVRDSIRTVSESPIPWGRLVTVEFETADTAVEVSGPTDRPIVGYIVVGLSAAAIVYEADPPNAPRRGSIWLQSSAAVRAKLWIF